MDGDLGVEERRRLFAQLTESTSDILWVFSADWSELLFVNSAYEEVWGRSIADLEEDPRDFLEGVHPDDRGAVREAMDRLSRGEATELEYRVNPDEDYRRWVWVEGRPIRDESGEVVRAAGFARDITERKRHERRLEALNDATRELMTAESKREVGEVAVRVVEDVLGEPLTGVWEYDAEADELIPLAASGSAVEFSNASAGTDVGVGTIPSGTAEMRVFEAGEISVIDDYDEIEDAANPGTPLGRLLLAPLGEHGQLHVGAEADEPFDASTRDLIEILARNVEATLDRVERENALRESERELQRQNDRLEAFTSVVSHDLRSPLTVAKGRVDLARQEHDGEHLETAAEALDRMEAILDDTLTLAHVGDTIDEFEAVALGSVADGCWRHVATDGAQLVVEDDPTVRADPGRLEQVLENLFRNAVEHAGPAPTVRVGAMEDANGFYVEDDGPGIPPERRGKVFEAGHTTAEAGTGFGLNIVDEIVEAHGWGIDVVEGDDGGARFEITGVELE